MRRWQNGQVIGHTRLYPEFRENFDAPYWVIHRAHFHQAMHDLAVDLGVTVRLASKVVSYDVDEPSITLDDDSKVFADLVVAADGVNSTARKVVLGADHPPQRTGFAAYRAVVDIDRMQGDPEVSWLLEKPAFNLWSLKLGDNRHVMTYVIGAGKSFNMVLSHPDSGDSSQWNLNPEETLQNMRNEFQDWDPVLTRIIGMIDKALKWPLFSGATMNRWVSGNLIVLGDAAHAMLPYMSQGAAIAVEDGIALARALKNIQSREDIPHALSVCERVRVDRAQKMQEASLLNGKLWHFADGPRQRARDEAMEPEVAGRPFSFSPNQWSDPATQMWCYSYDAEREIDREIPASPLQRNASTIAPNITPFTIKVQGPHRESEESHQQHLQDQIHSIPRDAMVLGIEEDTPSSRSINLETLEILEDDAVDTLIGMSAALPHLIEILKTLHIRSTHGLDFQFIAEDAFREILRRMENLQTLRLSVGEIFNDSSYLPTLHKYLPPNLTSFYFRGPVSLCQSEHWADWPNAFESPGFLPNLETMGFVLDLQYEPDTGFKDKTECCAPEDLLHAARRACELVYETARRRNIQVKKLPNEPTSHLRPVDHRW
ncbi:hypothetical protein NUU61_003485 [Penicillium alfredii]|uniref:FAD-binding domain-containing protein n=1 Tax=Penicillium alfredii TaxID=1506179 RepID=A0A9W9KCY0_9EURO|nr:uncharacterized protein NUU61_003485 [Penicillium alfredii]KAJ5101263.1 hypothetical protein NUU61_003485 [Penicillium alfredii]